jgi:hypothetical protein
LRLNDFLDCGFPAEDAEKDRVGCALRTIERNGAPDAPYELEIIFAQLSLAWMYQR